MWNKFVISSYCVVYGSLLFWGIFEGIFPLKIILLKVEQCVNNEKKKRKFIKVGRFYKFYVMELCKMFIEFNMQNKICTQYLVL